MDSIWAVRLLTAVEAVRTKRKAALRFWVGSGGDREGWGDIAISKKGKGRKVICSHQVLDSSASRSSACYRLGYSAKARLLARFHDRKT